MLNDANAEGFRCIREILELCPHEVAQFGLECREALRILSWVVGLQGCGCENADGLARTQLSKGTGYCSRISNGIELIGSSFEDH